MQRSEEDAHRCANCGRTPRPDENPDDEWRVYSDGVGELHTFCPECAEREFGWNPRTTSGLDPLERARR